MNIAVIGYYGMGNTGDERILQSLRLFFKHHRIQAFTIGLADKQIKEINSCDYVLIGGGGLLLRNSNRYYDFINKISRPLGIVGIGVEAINADMSKTIRLLEEKSEFFLVRDKESRELLSNSSTVIVGPDLTFLTNYPVVDPSEDDIVGLNLRSWFSINTEYGSQFWMLSNAIPKRLRLIETLWPAPKWEVGKFLEYLKCFSTQIVPLPFDFNGSDSDLCVLQKYFSYVPTTFNISIYQKIRYAVAMRFHAIAFSLQCGIPFVSLSYQPKCSRFCESIGMSDYCLDIYSKSDEIANKLSKLKENYDDIREHLIIERQRLNKDITFIMNKIVSTMENQVS